jgi:hypothetical protein
MPILGWDDVFGRGKGTHGLFPIEFNLKNPYIDTSKRFQGGLP